MSISKRIILYQFILFAFLLSLYVLTKKPPDVFYFLDVGQGDSSYFRVGKFEMVIDGGPDRRSLYELRKIRNPLDRHIDLLILTHHHADHLTGLLYLLDEYQIGAIALNFSSSNSLLSKELQSLVQKKAIRRFQLNKGQTLKIGNQFEMKILWPENNYLHPDLNNESIALQLNYGRCKLLLTGDLEAEFVGDAVFSEWLKSSNVIKVPHHGSKGSLPLNLVDSSKAYIISVGKKNRYKHPHLDTIKVLSNKSVFRTDLMGSIKVKDTVRGCEVASAYK